MTHKERHYYELWKESEELNKELQKSMQRMQMQYERIINSLKSQRKNFNVTGLLAESGLLDRL